MKLFGIFFVRGLFFEKYINDWRHMCASVLLQLMYNIHNKINTADEIKREKTSS